jgi:hypothetical protein
MKEDMPLVRWLKVNVKLQPDMTRSLMRFLTCFVAMFFFGVASHAFAAPANDVNSFYSSSAGFTIIKPGDWYFATTGQAAENRGSVRLKDKELEEMVRQRGSRPLVVLLKHQEPFGELNPSVQVVLNPLGELRGKSAVELMRLIAPSIQQAMTDFSIVEQIHEATVGGMPAAFMKSTGTVANKKGRPFAVLSRVWIVPRGSFLFMISMSGPQQGLDVSEAEFKEIADSILIDP